VERKARWSGRHKEGTRRGREKGWWHVTVYAIKTREKINSRDLSLRYVHVTSGGSGGRDSALLSH